MMRNRIRRWFRGAAAGAALVLAGTAAAADFTPSTGLLAARKAARNNPDATRDVLQRFITIGGILNIANVRLLNGLLNELGHRVDVRSIIDGAEARPIREQLVGYAAVRGINLR